MLFSSCSEVWWIKWLTAQLILSTKALWYVCPLPKRGTFSSCFTPSHHLLSHLPSVPLLTVRYGITIPCAYSSIYRSVLNSARVGRLKYPQISPRLPYLLDVVVFLNMPGLWMQIQLIRYVLNTRELFFISSAQHKLDAMMFLQCVSSLGMCFTKMAYVCTADLSGTSRCTIA